MNKAWTSSNLLVESVYAELPSRFYDALESVPQGDWRSSDMMSEYRPAIDTISENIESGCGVVVLKGFPLFDDIEKTETNYLKFLNGFGHILNQNNVGDLVSHVVDVNVSLDDVINKGIKDDQTRKQTHNRPYQTNAHLEFHTDLSDMAGLLCLHNAREGGDSRVVSAIAVFEEMQNNYSDELAALDQCFHINHQTPLKPDGVNHLIDIPIFTEKDGYFASFLLGTYIKMTYEAIGKKLSDKALSGIDRIQEIASRPEFHLKFRLEPGDLMLVNNHVVYHSRDSYVDHDGDAKRHLLRAWVSTYQNRPLHKDFLALYGDRLSAGTHRGGFEKVA